MTDRVLLYRAGNSAQCPAAAWLGGELGGEWTHGYVWLSPFAVCLKLSQHRYLATLQYKMKRLKKKKERIHE